ncbi:putative prefoldin alpha subunit [Babesia bovis T2Bo]|uniref:Prefoldin subunit 5 (C-myc binding protein), putative n=1 Tax=Babesia bovis TaxID=5865 RepID=A7AV52_BABBO|nr:putative prefoldin alpha subunit [Babesia bovis T2Bo]EDO05678.1 putative prefoldin alpha subunit [Babesia bovis T2Bo]|eukprot:XP_001609246.1 prefoldin subunit 5 (c-myc binding protein) [Babesia bovis T2Bo]
MSLPLDASAQVITAASDANVHNLSIQELNMIILRLEEEINQMQNLVNVLTVALERLHESKACLKDFSSQSCEIQVPLTSLVYVPGKIANPGKVLVSVGTGYFIEMTLDKAGEFYERKIEVVEEQLRKLHSICSAKNKQITQTYSVLDHKLSQLRNAQAAATSQVATV